MTRVHLPLPLMNQPESAQGANLACLGHLPPHKNPIRQLMLAAAQHEMHAILLPACNSGQVPNSSSRGAAVGPTTGVAPAQLSCSTERGPVPQGQRLRGMGITPNLVRRDQRGTGEQQTRQRQQTTKQTQSRAASSLPAQLSMFT